MLARYIESYVALAVRKSGGVWQDVQLRLQWGTVVGAPWAGCSTLRKVIFPKNERCQGTLVIEVSSAFAVYISYGKAEILECVNRYYGYPAVCKIQLRHRMQKCLPNQGPS